MHSVYNATVGNQSGVMQYKKQARDSACATSTYVTWVTTDPDSSYPGALPCGGPLVESIIMSSWIVV